jgi:hypothetical protein
MSARTPECFAADVSHDRMTNEAFNISRLAQPALEGLTY